MTVAVGTERASQSPRCPGLTTIGGRVTGAGGITVYTEQEQESTHTWMEDPCVRFRGPGKLIWAGAADPGPEQLQAQEERTKLCPWLFLLFLQNRRRLEASGRGMGLWAGPDGGLQLRGGGAGFVSMRALLPGRPPVSLGFPLAPRGTCRCGK